MASPFDDLEIAFQSASVLSAPEYARGLRLATEAQVPVDTAMRNADELERRQNRPDMRQYAAENPLTAGWLRNNLEAVPAVQDDLEEMSIFERMIGDVGVNFEKSLNRFNSQPHKLRALFGQADDYDEAMIRYYQAEAAGLEQEASRYGLSNPWQSWQQGRYGDFLAAVPGAVVEQSTILADQVVSRAAGFGIGFVGGAAAGVGTGPGMLATGLAGAAVGQNLGGFISSYKMESALLYEELRDLEGIDEDHARYLAGTAAIPIASLEFLPITALTKKIPGVGRTLTAWTTDAMVEVLKKQSFRSATKHLVFETAGQAGVEGVTEVLQETLGILAEMAGHELAGDNWEEALVMQVPQPDGSVVELVGMDAVMARLMTAGVRGAQGGGGMSGIITAGGVVSDVATAERSETRWELGARLTRLAQRSNLREQQPELYQDYVREVVEQGAAPEHVYVNAENLREHFETMPDEEAEALLEQVPALLEQDAEVLRTGGDFVIPMDQYLRGMAPSSILQNLGEHIRFAAEDLSQAEVREKIESGAFAREFSSILERVDDEEAGVLVAVREHQEEQLRRVHAPTQAAALAAWQVARLQRRVEALREDGVDISIANLIAQQGLPVIRPPETSDEAMAKIVENTPTLEQRLERRSILRQVDDLRKNRRRALESMPARPVLSALRDIGGIDPDSPLAGDLESLGVARRGRGSFPGIYRRGAEGLDQRDLTESPITEWLGEFLELDEYGRGDPNAILGLIEQELAGQGPRPFEQAEQLAQERQGREALLNAMEAAGVKLTDDDQKIAEALVPVAARRAVEPVRPEGRQFFQVNERRTVEETVASEAFQRWLGDARLVLEPELHDFQPGEAVVVLAYHGTTHELDTVEAGVGNPENFLGRAFYATSSEQDALDNYAGIGPDLTARIQQRVDQLEQEMMDDLEGFDLPPDTLPGSSAISAKAYEVAQSELVGALGEEGQVLPVFIKLENPAILAGDQRAGHFVELYEYGEEDADGDVEIDESRLEAVVDYLEGLTQNDGLWDVNVESIVQGLTENGGEITVDDLVDAVKHDNYATDETGRLFASEMAMGVLQALGFDGVIQLDAAERWRNMAIPADAVHVIVPDPGGAVKSTQASVFDPKSDRIFFQPVGELEPVPLEKKGPLYSKMRQVLEDKLPAKGTPQSYRSTIEKMGKTGKYKADELDVSGLIPWLMAHPAKKLTKDEVFAFLDAQGPSIILERRGGRNADQADRNNLNVEVDIETFDRDAAYDDLIEGEREFVRDYVEQEVRDRPEDFGLEPDEDGNIEDFAINDEVQNQLNSGAWDEMVESQMQQAMEDAEADFVPYIEGQEWGELGYRFEPYSGPLEFAIYDGDRNRVGTFEALYPEPDEIEERFIEALVEIGAVYDEDNDPSGTEYENWTVPGDREEYQEVTLALPEALTWNVTRFLSERGLDVKDAIAFDKVLIENGVARHFGIEQGVPVERWEAREKAVLEQELNDYEQGSVENRNAVLFRAVKRASPADLRKHHETWGWIAGLLRHPDATIGPVYRDPHFHQERTIGHYRRDLRKPPSRVEDGVEFIPLGPIFFLEELQSDWHNDARKDYKKAYRALRDEGYSREEAKAAASGYIDMEAWGKLKTQERLIYQLGNDRQTLERQIEGMEPGSDAAHTYMKGAMELRERLRRLRAGTLVPPFDGGGPELSAEEYGQRRQAAIDRETAETESALATLESAFDEQSLSPRAMEVLEAIRNLDAELLVAKARLREMQQDTAFEWATKGVPNAPLKNAWRMLVFKHALLDAIEQGAKRFQWATGAQTAEHYSLRKTVDRIETGPTPAASQRFAGKLDVDIVMQDNRGTIGLIVEPSTGIVLQGDDKFFDEDLRDIIGTEVAERVLAAGNRELEKKQRAMDRDIVPYPFSMVDQGTTEDRSAQFALRRRDAGEEVFAVRSREGIWDRYEETTDWSVIRAFTSEAEAQAYIEASAERAGLDSVQISGKDLELGGEWAVHLYDNTMPREIGKLLKPWGVEVKKLPLEVGHRAIPRFEPNSIWENATADDVAESLQGVDRTEGAAELSMWNALNSVEHAMRNQGLSFQRAMSLHGNALVSSTFSMGAFEFDREIRVEDTWGFEITDELVRGVREEGMELFQPEDTSEGPTGAVPPKGERRGSVRIAPDLSQKEIVWTEKADLSTFLHENGHVWLEELKADAALAGEGSALARDLQVLRQFFGLEEGQDFSDKHHERFARMVEQWIMEGNAPSLELEPLFMRFQRWLVDVYRTIRNSYFGGPQLTDEVRGILDRMVASEEAIQEARNARGLSIELFEDAGEAGMDLQEWNDYRGALEQGRLHARTWMVRKMVAEEKRKLAKEWRRLREIEEKHVLEEIAGEGLWAARHWLQRNTSIDGRELFEEAQEHVRLDRDDLVARWGRDILKEIPRGKYGVWQKDGAPVDLVASWFGVDADELVRFLADTKGTPLKDEIARRTDANMKDKHGTLETSEQLEQAAVEALNQDAALRALLIEERALARKSGGRATAEKLLRLQAKRTVQDTRIMDLRPDRLRRAAEKAARDAQRFVQEGDAKSAQLAKQRQVFSLMVEVEARRGRERSERNQEFFYRIQDSKNATRIKLVKAGDRYVDQVDKLMERFGFKRISRKKIEQRQKLRDFLSDRERDDESVAAIPEWVRDEAMQKNWKELTVSELDGLRDSVDNIVTLARRKVELMVGSEHREMDALAEELAQVARDNVGARLVTPPGSQRRGLKGKWDRGTAALMSYEASLLKIEQVIDRIDGFVPDGLWRKTIWQPLRDAATERLEMSEKITAQYERMVKELAEGRARELNEVKHYPELERPGVTDGRYSKWSLIVIALNLGNESNAMKLTKGYNWNEQQLLAILERELTAKDLAFVQETWNLVNSLWPKIVEQEKKLSGVIPEAVEGRDVKIGGTTLKGRYFPVVYDLQTRTTQGDTRVQEWGEAGELFETEQNQFRRPLTGHGHTERRTGAAFPILLEASVIASHLDQVVLDLTHRETLMRIDKILRRPDIKQALNETIGEEDRKQFRPWLQRIASDRYIATSSLQGMDRIYRFFRTRTTALGLGLRATTLAMQVGGHSNGIQLLRDRLGRKNYLRHYMGAVGQTGMAFSPGRLLALQNEVFELSGFMRDRVANLDRDMRQIQREAERSGALPGEKMTDFPARARSWALGLIGRMQMNTVDLPIWLAAYNGALEDLGLDGDAAVSFADQMVSQSQGSGAAMDLSAVQAGAEAYKLATMFFSYQNTVYQQLRNSFLRARDKGEYWNAAGTAVFWLMAPAVFSQLVRSVLSQHGELPEEPEDWPWWLAGATLNEALGTIPVVREVSPLVGQAFGYGKYFPSRTASQRFAEDFQRAAHFNDDDWFLELAAFVTGWVGGLPTAGPIDAYELLEEGKK